MPETRRTAFQALRAHARTMESAHIADLFAADPDRFARFSARNDDLLLDFSKNRINDETMELLLSLARGSRLEEWRARMFSGDLVNMTEGRAVLHVALRNPGRARPYAFEGRDVTGDVEAVLEAFPPPLRWPSPPRARPLPLLRLKSRPNSTSFSRTPAKRRST